MADKTPQPLGNQFPIVDDEGKPTIFMTRWANQRQVDIQDSVSTDEATTIADTEALKALHDHSVLAGTGLSGGGTLDNDPTLNLHADIGQLLDVDTTTTPPTTAQALTWNGTKWVPGAGGGGSGIYMPAVLGDIPCTFVQLPDGNLVYTEVL